VTAELRIKPFGIPTVDSAGVVSDSEFAEIRSALPALPKADTDMLRHQLAQAIGALRFALAQRSAPSTAELADELATWSIDIGAQAKKFARASAPGPILDALEVWGDLDDPQPTLWEIAQKLTHIRCHIERALVKAKQRAGKGRGGARRGATAEQKFFNSLCDLYAELHHRCPTGIPSPAWTKASKLPAFVRACLNATMKYDHRLNGYLDRRTARPSDALKGKFQAWKKRLRTPVKIQAPTAV